MKKYILLLIYVLAIASPLKAGDCKKQVPDDHARKFAIMFLKQQNVFEDYIFQPESTIRNGCEWIVSFKRKDWEIVKPSRGLISVHITTGEAKWLPSR